MTRQFALWGRQFAAWMKGKNITTHSVGAAIVAFAVAYNASATVRDYIGTALVGFPVVVTKIGVLSADIVGAVTLWRNYSRSSNAAGILATARAVNDNPNGPTVMEVNAADPKVQ
jgi:hypothetical protein